MKKKFSELQKDIEDQRENIKVNHASLASDNGARMIHSLSQTMRDKEEQLTAHTRALRERIAQYKEEIDERDKTIGDKEVSAIQS